MKQRNLHIVSLDCEHDASRLRRSLQDVPGVEVLQISPVACRVRLALDDSQISPEELESRLSAAGFPVARDTERVGAPPWGRSTGPQGQHAALSSLTRLS